MAVAGALRNMVLAVAFAFVLVPGGVAHAQSFGVSGYEQVTQQQGILSGASATVAAVCPAGKQVVGGGFDLGTSGTLEVSMSAPGGSGSLTDDRWLVSVRNAGTLMTTATAVAECVTRSVPGYEIRTSSVSVPAGGAVQVPVLCSTGGKVLAGGFQLESASAFDLFRSLPTNTSSSFIDNGWNVFVQSHATSARQVVAFAVCVAGTVSGYERAVDQPTLAPGVTVDVAAACAAGRKVTGGGFRVETPDDVKLFSTEPGNAQGVPIDNGWTNRVRNVGSVNRGVTVAAICVDGTGTTPPDTTITGGPSGPTNDTTPTFTFTGTPTATTFECRVDTAAFATCRSPFTTTALGAGAHTFQVRAIDAAGNVDASPASRAFTVDTTAPDTTITGGPTGPTNDTTPTFTFTSTEGGSTFECRVDTAAFASCTTPFTTAALGAGAHTFEVRAIDAAGNSDASPASRAFSVDTTAPDTTITGGPTGATNDTTPTFTFTSTEGGSTFECRVDTAAFATCTTPFTTAALGAGAHTFEVRAIDAAGNVDATAASRAFTVDTSAPDTTITGGPAGPTNDTTPTFTFTSTEGGSTFECRVDTAAFATCSTPFTTAALGTGAHTFEVRATDAAGTVDPSPASQSFTVDTTAPDTTITGGPAGPTNDTTPTFTFTSTEGGSTFECRVDTAAFATCTTPFTTAALGAGAHTFEVRAIDAAGNVDATPASRAFTVDTTAPDTTITGGPAGPTNDNTPTFTFTSTEAGSIFECRVDTAAFTSCTTPFTTAGLTNGAHTFEVRATDAAGNVDGSPASRAFTVDTVAPDTTITGGPADPTNDSTPTFTFTSTEAGSFECRVDTAAFATCSSPFTTGALGDGAHTFEVRALDTEGNADASPASAAFTVDTIAPDTTITSGPTGPTSDPTPTFAFTSTEAGSTFECRVDTAAFATCDSPQTTAALADGAHTFEVRAMDAAGNGDASPASRAFTVDTTVPDTTPPDTPITGGPDGPTNDATPTFEFAASEPGSSFECSVDNGAFQPCSSPFTTAALTSGAHSFAVRAIDAAGNVDPSPGSRIFTVVSTPTLGGSSGDAGPPPDRDADTVADTRDNCVDVPNTPQADKDADGIGDACDESDASVGPTLAKAVVGQVVSGQVFVRFPRGTRSATRAAQAPPKGFVPLKGAEVLPVGTIVDARAGRLALTSAASRVRGRTQTQRAEFFEGTFQIRQRRAARPTTDLVLRSTNFAKVCGSAARSAGAAVEAAAARRSRKVVTRLRGNGKGRFRTIGRHSAATVRGTIWLTDERCDGTLTRVSRGIVSVRDTGANRTVILRAGQSYLARAARAAVKTRRP